LKVPVIARSVGEIPTVLLQGKGGQLIAGMDPADYLAAMMKVLESPDVTDKACSLAQENLMREYTADTCAARYLSLYERLRQPAANDD
jgi:glycosyltransferase involved in cell wall biosynthesis